MLLCGAWTAVFAIPIFVTLRDRRPDVLPEKIGIAGAYRELFQSIKWVWDNSRHLLYFFIASAIFRDGLAGEFHVAGVREPFQCGDAERTGEVEVEVGFRQRRQAPPPRDSLIGHAPDPSHARCGRDLARLGNPRTLRDASVGQIEGSQWCT